MLLTQTFYVGAAGSSTGSPIGMTRPTSRIVPLLVLSAFVRDVGEIMVVIAVLVNNVAPKKTRHTRSTAFKFNLSPPLCFSPQNYYGG